MFIVPSAQPPPKPPPMYEVVRWASVAQTELEKTPLSYNDLTSAEMLAFIDLESEGDPYANRDGSQYESLLQIGRPAIREIHRWSLRVGWSGDLAELIVDDKGKPDQKRLKGEGALSIRSWLFIYWVYRKRHAHDNVLKAVFWKGGPGTLKKYKALYDTEGREAADDFLRSMHHKGIPSGVSYIEKLEKLTMRYQRYVDSLNARYRICSPMIVDPEAFTVMTPWSKVESKRQKLSI